MEKSRLFTNLIMFIAAMHVRILIKKIMKTAKSFYTLLLILGLEEMIFLTYDKLADTLKQEYATLRNSLSTLFPLSMILNGNL